MFLSFSNHALGFGKDGISADALPISNVTYCFTVLSRLLLPFLSPSRQ